MMVALGRGLALSAKRVLYLEKVPFWAKPRILKVLSVFAEI